MPWWLVWVLLVLAALALLVWIGLRLYRAFRALMVELEQAQQVLQGARCQGRGHVHIQSLAARARREDQLCGAALQLFEQSG